MAIAFPLALFLSVLPQIISLFVPQFATVYLISAYLVVFLAVFGICLVLLGFHNKIARRLSLTVAISCLLGALAHYWLLIEVFFLGFQITYPNISAYLAAAANAVLLLGFALLSIEQRRRSKRQIVGYVLLTLFFAVCILSTYQMNLTYHPPILPAIGTGVRILLGFFTAIFAWAFYFNQDPPLEIIGRSSRLLLMFASIFLILGYTVFAFQYASGWSTISAFYYGGSISDTLTLFAIFVFLIAIMVLFTETLENMATIRPLSVKYQVLTRVLLIISLLVGTTLTATISITLIGHVLRVFLSPIDALVALQTIGVGLLMGFGVIILVFGAMGYLLSQWLYRPLEQLERETMAVTEPGIISYTEPPGLVFTELQGVSDSFTEVLNELARVRAELRRFTITESQLRVPSTSQLSRLDYYLAILNNTITNRLQTIMNFIELGRATSNQQEQTQYLNLIQTEINEIHYLQQSIQLLRLIDTQALPEFHRFDLIPMLTNLIQTLQEAIPDSRNQISLSFPEKTALVIANEYVIQIFQPLFRLVLERDMGGPATIEVNLSTTKEVGVDYWQINLAHPKWVLSDIEKVLLFRSDPEQPQKANPNLLLVPALVEYFRGKFHVKNIVIDDPQYGTVLQVLLPRADSCKPQPQEEEQDSGSGAE